MDKNMMKKAMSSYNEGKAMEKKGYMAEENDDMQSKNNMKSALSQAIKTLTQYVSNMPDDEMQDGNTGNTVGGEQGFSAMEYDSKKAMLVNKMKKMMG